MDRASKAPLSARTAAAVALAPRALVVLHDLGMAWLAWAALEVLRERLAAGAVAAMLFSPTVVLLVLTQGAVFWASGLYRGLWRFASIPDMVNIARAGGIGLLAIAVELLLLNREGLASRAMLLMYPVVLVVLVGGPRLLYRAWKDRRMAGVASHAVARVLVYGAGHTGDALARRMLREGTHEPVGFLDDDPRLRGRKLRGVPVLGDLELLPQMARATGADLVAIAVPGIALERMRRAVALCDEAGIAFRRVRHLSDWLGQAGGDDPLRELAIEDLLGREPVVSDQAVIRSWITGRAVLVTGAGGSIGAELCRQSVALGVGSLTLLERDELALITISEQIRRLAPGLVVHAVLGDCGDPATMAHALRLGRVQAVLHAAACKHVPLLEEQVREAVRNNVLATRVVVDASIAGGVESFVLISSDKAVDPISVLGASKRMAEMACLATDAAMAMAIMRFGNVLDSAGSVVPIFREQIARGGPVTVTHPEVTRYFMTIAEACELILQAASLGARRALYTLDMGEPVPIRLLAEQMIRLAGQVPGHTVQIVYTGLRAGEKMHERLYHVDEENRMSTHPKILVANPRGVDAARVQQQILALRAAVRDYDEARLCRVLQEAIPEFEPARGAVVLPLPVRRRSRS